MASTSYEPRLRTSACRSASRLKIGPRRGIALPALDMARLGLFTSTGGAPGFSRVGKRSLMNLGIMIGADAREDTPTGTPAGVPTMSAVADRIGRAKSIGDVTSGCWKEPGNFRRPADFPRGAAPQKATTSTLAQQRTNQSNDEVKARAICVCQSWKPYMCTDTYHGLHLSLRLTYRYYFVAAMRSVDNAVQLQHSWPAALTKNYTCSTRNTLRLERRTEVTTVTC
mmetsp:Transcript_14316/g.37148  ORF Transcript_14316/g.37148 Transcript_14316/m.37148 type:complete len:226 (+) Transcript_14316:728-1405(+)